MRADADDVKDEPREEGAPREEDAEDDAEGVVNVPRRARTGAWFIFFVCVFFCFLCYFIVLGSRLIRFVCLFVSYCLIVLISYFFVFIFY